MDEPATDRDTEEADQHELTPRQADAFVVAQFYFNFSYVGKVGFIVSSPYRFKNNIEFGKGVWTDVFF